MGLREVALEDSRAIHEDPQGFAWSCELKTPEGETYSLQGLSNDINLAVDPDSGALVSSRTISFSLSMKTLNELGVTIPRGLPSGKPYLISFDDILGRPLVTKVIASDPDYTLGFVVCQLGVYNVT